MSDTKKCKTCGRDVSVWPMAFRGDDYCSVICDKASRNGKKPKKPKKKALIQMGADE